MLVLGIPHRIATAPTIAGPRVQPAVGTELELAAIVIVVQRMGDLDDRIGARFVRRFRSRGIVANDPDVAVQIREVHVHALVRRILRMEREAQQPALTA